MLFLFQINHDPPGEYQLANHVVYLNGSCNSVALDKWLYETITLLAINKLSQATRTQNIKNVLLRIKNL